MTHQARIPAVAVTGLRKAFGATTVLDGIDLTIPAGSIFALLGPNGAGKTAVDDPAAMALVMAITAEMPPAWRRLDQLCQEKAQARGLTPRAGG